MGELGPFFAFDVLGCFSDGWSNLGRDLASAEFRSRWADRLRSDFARGLGVTPGDVNARAVHSVLHLGLMSRALSPWIAQNVLGGAQPAPSLGDLWWRPDGTTRFRLAVEGEPASASRDEVLDSLWSLAAELNALGIVASHHVRWGNTVSAVNGAATTLVRLRPERSQAALLFAEELVTRFPPSLFTGRIGSPGFRRQSCCLINTLVPESQSAICGDCVHAKAC